MQRVLKLKVEKVKNAVSFFALLEECGPGGFYHNRTSLLKGYTDGLLYTVAGEAAEGEYDDPIWAKFNIDVPACYHGASGRRHILPCFCLVEADSCDIIWVHPRIRKQGVATLLLKSLKIKHANHPLPESKEFWEKYFSRTGEFTE
jgi:GNAT superfamily N-acetyltransferase